MNSPLIKIKAQKIYLPETSRAYINFKLKYYIKDYNLYSNNSQIKHKSQ